MNRSCLLGIEIGGTKLQVVRGIAGGRILDRHRFQVDAARGAAGIRNYLEDLLPKLAAEHRPAAVGVGFGGPVDHRTGLVCCSHQVEGWSGFDLGPWVQSLCHAPVRVDNDANTAALAEASQGAGRDHNPVFYVTLGSGVGGGCVVDGAIYHGALPGEAEIGHVRLDRSGAVVEDRCSGWAVDRRVREQAALDPMGALARLCAADPEHEARHLPAALAAGDGAAQSILDDTATDLAFALSHVTHLFHPEMIVLGGGLSLLGEPLAEAVRLRLPGFVMRAFDPGPAVTLALLREDAVPVGALLLAALQLHGDRRQESR
jgi:glucokinase